jgi:diadenylate cyclase
MTLFEWQFLKFGLKDLIDVLIVGFIIYESLKLMRGTRSVQIITGLFLIFLVAFCAYWFQLEGLTWLFSNLATFGLIVLVIVFQPELRGVLAEWGRGPLFRGFGGINRRKWLEEISRATLRLAELRYGGLFVIERKTGLRNFSETGKEMNAGLSSELLVTLFTPYTPLHDGAIIIRGDTIVAAAASLPLTANPKYSKLYGMRHKAAIGVTEVSDAVVVVVSEETHAISIAHDGELESNIEKGELRERLASYLEKR